MMPSPFPGMDPYLEGYLWPDVHHRLATQMSDQLMPLLRPRYVARIEIQVVLDETSEADIGIMYQPFKGAHVICLSVHYRPSQLMLYRRPSCWAKYLTVLSKKVRSLSWYGASSNECSVRNNSMPGMNVRWRSSIPVRCSFRPSTTYSAKSSSASSLRSMRPIGTTKTPSGPPWSRSIINSIAWKPTPRRSW